METKKRVTVYLSQEALINLRKQAKDKGMSRSARLEELILERNVNVTPQQISKEEVLEKMEEMKKEILQKLKERKEFIMEAIREAFPSSY